MAVVVSGIIASGGGTRNSYLMERLYAQMPSHLRMTTTNEFGVPAAFKETIKFATLAHAIIFGHSNNINTASGAMLRGDFAIDVTPI